MKIGWPGIIIVEGREYDCNEFYDTIRRWPWKYLVVRGEERLPERQQPNNDAAGVDPRLRRFHSFQEMDDMSTLAARCHDVGLHDLFRTSMKVYQNSDPSVELSSNDDKTTSRRNNKKNYGALIHVDHMNDGKGYRKWLRKVAREMGVSLLVRQVFLVAGGVKTTTTSSSNRNHGSDSRGSIIIVVLVGDDKDDVSSMLKRWRTYRVDVDSCGKPCLERKMKVIIEGELPPTQHVDDGEWDYHHHHHHHHGKGSSADKHLHSTREQLTKLIDAVGGKSWTNVFQECV